MQSRDLPPQQQAAQLAALTLTQFCLLDSTQPLVRVRHLDGILRSSHGDPSARLRSVSWVLTLGVWQERETASFV